MKIIASQTQENDAARLLHPMTICVRERTAVERESGWASSHFISLRTRDDQKIGEAYARLTGNTMEIDFAVIFIGLRNKGFYKSALAHLALDYTVRSDDLLKPGAENAYRSLGALRLDDGRYELPKDSTRPLILAEKMHAACLARAYVASASTMRSPRLW